MRDPMTTIVRIRAGEKPVVVLSARGPDGSWLKDTGTGQQGITAIRCRAYERTSPSTPTTMIANVTLTRSTVVPYTGVAAGPGITGDGYGEEEHNVVHALDLNDFPLPQTGVVSLVYEFDLSGVGAGSQPWGTIVRHALVQISPLEGA